MGKVTQMGWLCKETLNSNDVLKGFYKPLLEMEAKVQNRTGKSSRLQGADNR